MSHSKLLLLLLPLGFILNPGHAESQRPLFSLENAFPRWTQLEVGASYNAIEKENGFIQNDTQTTTAYLRYGLRENFAIQIDVPYVNIDPAFTESESGLGDVVVELQLRTFEDIFGYPYYIPHVSVTLPTGDEEKGLGNEDSIVVVGMSYGDKINDMLNWIVDFSYRINPNIDNQLLLSNSYIYDVSEKFSLLAELRYEEEIEDDDESLVLLTGGFSYSWTQDFRMGAYVGGAITGDTNVFSEVNVSFNF